MPQLLLTALKSHRHEKQSHRFSTSENDHFDNLLTVDMKEVCLILSDAQRKVYICINTGGAFLKGE